MYSCIVLANKRAHSHCIQLSILHATRKTIASTYRVHVSILYMLVFMYNDTQMRLSRPPGVSHSFTVSPSHFPTEFLTPYPAGYWLHSPPILMHSFHLATRCRPLPSTSCCQSHLHGSVIDRFRAGRTFQPMTGQTLVFMCRNGKLGLMLEWVNTV